MATHSTIATIGHSGKGKTMERVNTWVFVEDGGKEWIGRV